jgi:hypothetical protein
MCIRYIYNTNEFCFYTLDPFLRYLIYVHANISKSQNNLKYEAMLVLRILDKGYSNCNTKKLKFNFHVGNNI